MQLADGDARASEPSERAFLSPGKAFALLFGVILVLGGAIFLLRPDDLPRESVTYPAGGDAPTFELTDAEAITRFEQLDALRLQMYEQRDTGLISLFLTSDSPLHETATSEIQRLRADRVQVAPNFETRSLQIVSNSDSEITLMQVVVEAPRFTSQSGNEVTETPPKLKTIRWVLHLENSVWKIFSSDTIKSRDL